MCNTMMIALLSMTLFLSGLLSGCAASQSGSAYPRAQARSAQEVQLGQVEHVRPVQLEGTKSNVGTAAGAALGGIAGSAISGSSRGQALGAVGGAVLGGLAGAAAEEGLTRTQGQEIIVRLDNGRAIAVTQADETLFSPGQRVYIVTAADGTTRVARY